MLTKPAQVLVLAAALVVFGALAGMLSVMTVFPLNLLLLVLPLGLCFAIPALHTPPAGRPGLTQVLVETGAVWTGYAVSFHAYHGFWDGQGIGMGLVGFVVAAPIVFVLIRRRVPAPAAARAA